VKLRLRQYNNCSWCHWKELPELLRGCELPAVVLGDQNLIMSGLCSTLRYIVQTAQQGLETAVDRSLSDCLLNLLGLRQNCLRACAEVSEWTLYTEVMLPQLVEKVISPDKSDVVGDDPWPELLQLENQLSKLPVEPSRHRNRKQRESKQSSNTAVINDHTAKSVTKREWDRREKVDTPGKLMTSENLECDISVSTSQRFENLWVAESSEEICGRRFVEGSSVQLTDLTIFVCVQLIFSSNNVERWCSHFCRIMSWYQRIAAIPSVSNAIKSTGLTEYHHKADNVAVQNSAVLSSTATDSDTFPKPVEDKLHSECQFMTQNLMHSKNSTYDQNCIQQTNKTKFRASQDLIDSAIAKATGMGLPPELLTLGNGECLQLPWEQYPSWVLPHMGGVPDKRAAKKVQQLENIAAAVKEIVSTRSNDSSSEGGTIVDFCSGGGHVGILLAYLFPQYKVCNLQ